ncbi:MAG: undecaprenyl-diphosphatase UppP [Candidatus Falkowbacteria bacterium]
MNVIHALILGVIEGLTEFLPISSTAHLALFSNFILHIPSDNFSKTFEIFIQLGAILAVLVVFWKKFWHLEMIKKLIVAFIPTAIIGLLMYHILKTFLLSTFMLMAWSLLIGGCAIILFELYYAKKFFAKNDPEKISYKQCLFLGLFQSIAIIPGVSRSAATIIGGLGMGLKRETVVEFSFLLAVPTILAASLLDLYKSAGAITVNQGELLVIGSLVAFVVALGVIKFLMAYIRKHDFKAFGIYRIILGLLLIMFILF